MKGKCSQKYECPRCNPIRQMQRFVESMCEVVEETGETSQWLIVSDYTNETPACHVLPVSTSGHHWMRDSDNCVQKKVCCQRHSFGCLFIHHFWICQWHHGALSPQYEWTLKQAVIPVVSHFIKALIYAVQHNRYLCITADQDQSNFDLLFVFLSIADHTCERILFVFTANVLVGSAYSNQLSHFFTRHDFISLRNCITQHQQ